MHSRELPGIGSGDRAQALNVLIMWTQRGQSIDVRSAAIRALGKVLLKARPAEKAKILAVFDQLGDEDHFRLRMQLVHSLADSECVEAVPTLQKIARLDTDGRVKRSTQNSIDSLLTSGGVPASVSNLKVALQKLEEDYLSLRCKFEEKGLAAGSSCSHLRSLGHLTFTLLWKLSLFFKFVVEERLEARKKRSHLPSKALFINAANFL